MAIKITDERTGSPVPGIVPGATRVVQDPPATSTTASVSPPRFGRLARLASAVHGDKYLSDAYPPQWRGPRAAHRAADPTALRGGRKAKVSGP
jgi:hypothetical protein